MANSENGKKHTKSGIMRLWNALFYSYDGLREAFKNEEAFRQELLLSVVLIPIAIILPISFISKALMISSVIFLLIVELLNSAIEAIVDRISTEKHPLAKRAKDMGSAAVLLSIINLTVIWVFCLLQHFCY